jgi:hypothetical protein
VLCRGGVQFVIGSMLEGEQGIGGVRQDPQDFVELALCRSLLARLRAG